MNPYASRNDFLAYMDSTLLCPLSRCILEGNTNTLKRLLCKRKKNPTPLQANIRGWTALHIAAFKDEHADCLKLLLTHKNTLGLNIDAKTLSGETAFYLACSEGCVKNCTILLEDNCNAGIPEGMSGCTPLHIASIHGHAGIVSQLIARGLNSNCQDYYTKYTPLHYACKMGRLEVVRELMRSKQTNLDIGYYNAACVSPLYLACKKGSLEIVRILVEADHNLVNRCYRHAYTPLIGAIKSRNVECVKYLLDRGAEANHCTTDGKTALHFALQNGVKEILELIIQATDMNYICEHFMREIRDFSFTHTHHVEVHSLISSAIHSSSPECILLLLESDIPKGILETPSVCRRYLDDVCSAYSPIAHLFHKARSVDREGTRDKFDELLRLLLQRKITHLHDFRKMIELKAPLTSTIHYMHPFTYIFEGPWSPVERDQYVYTLFEYDITTDFCLQCDVHYNCLFGDFDVNVLDRFYKPVILAMNKDNAEFIELLLVNSAILEPSHLWNFLQYQFRRPVMMGLESPRNVVNYLIDLGVVVNTSTLPWAPFGGAIIKFPNLQQLCRQTIRKHLRDVTIQDNLKNFKQKINALPLPNSLKDYLRFRRR